MARTKPDTARKVLVTGGSRGLGLAIAKQLAGAGYDVIAVARRTGKEVTAAIANSGRAGQGTLQFHPFDLGNIEQIPDLVRQLRKESRTLYALVNNAALGTDGVLATMHNSQIEELVRVNMLSPILLTKYVARTMMAGGRPHRQHRLDRRLHRTDWPRSSAARSLGAARCAVLPASTTWRMPSSICSATRRATFLARF